MAHKYSSGWARRRAERTEAIVEAGLRLVVSGGIDSLTVGRLSKAVGMTPGALYRYFPSKDAIIAELNLRVLTRWTSHLSAVHGRICDGDGPLVPVAAAGLTFAALAEREPEALALIALTSADPRVLTPGPEPAHVPPMMHLLGEIGQQIEACPLTDGDPRYRATALIFGLLGVLQTGKFARFDDLFAPSNLARCVVRDFLLGWGATPEATDTAIARADEHVHAALETL